MSITEIDAAPVAVSADKITQRPRRGKVVNRIRQTARCTRAEAEDFLSWTEQSVDWMRAGNHKQYFLKQDEWNKYHDILSAIAKDNTSSRPGSTHELVERFVLQPENGEYALLHSSAVVGKFKFCTYDMVLCVLR